jgi:hypothetical protein
MTWLAQLLSRMNAGMNATFALLNGPMRSVPAWLSLSMISALLGVVLLVLFKYTSPQTAIGRVRDRIKANLLAMKLFKDSVPAVLKAQFRVFAAAFMLLVYSLPPVLVMIVPFSLVLGQLGVWYEAAPLAVDQQAVITMQLSETPGTSLPEVELLPSDAVRIVAGPVRVPAKQKVYWRIMAVQPGLHDLQFKVGDEQIGKQISIGSGQMPVSAKRPSLNIEDVILYPAETPFSPSSPVQSIAIAYPDRTGPLTGSGNWVITFFVVSMLAALAVKPLVGVKL